MPKLWNVSNVMRSMQTLNPVNVSTTNYDKV